jgi:hypothetical protein
VPELTADQRRLRASIAAHALHAKYDSRELTANGRARFLQKFIDEVDPRRELTEAERLRRAEHALRSYMAKLALRSARARSARKAGGDG